MSNPQRAHTALIRAFTTRLGHDTIWLAVAGLFCVVEGAVKLTEFTPAMFRRRRPRLAVPLSSLRHG